MEGLDGQAVAVAQAGRPPVDGSPRSAVDTARVQLCGGPGIGKSNLAQSISIALRSRGCRAEYVPEFAKDLVWSGATKDLADQVYVFAVQRHREQVLWGTVDVVVTDSPTFLSPIYDRSEDPAMRSALRTMALADARRPQSMTLLLERDPAARYDAVGRVHSLADAQAKDREIAAFLDTERIPYDRVGAHDVRTAMHLISQRLDLPLGMP
jgi:hypothetical protein